MLPLTGPLDFFAPSTTAGAELAVEDINAAGGVFGQPVQLTQGDSGFDAEVANATVDDYLDDDTQVIVGALTSGISREIIDKVTGAGRIQISPANTGVDFTNYPDDGLYFRTSPSDALQGTVFAEQIAAESSTATVAFIDDDDYGIGIASAFASAFELLTTNAPTMVPYDAGGPYGTVVEQIEAADAEALLLVGVEDTVPVLLGLDAAGIGPAQGVNVWGVEAFIGDIGAVVPAATLNGLRGTVYDPEVRDAAFAARLDGLGVPLSHYAGETYDAIVIAALAAVIAGSDDPARIAEEIVGVTRHGRSCSSFAACAALIGDGVNIDYSGVGGEYEFDNCGEPTVANVLVLGYDGESAPVLVDELAGVPSTPLGGEFACAQPDTLSDVLDSIIPQGGPGSSGLHAKLAQGQYAAFINQVEAKCCLPTTGKLFTREEADLLIAMATELL